MSVVIDDHLLLADLAGTSQSGTDAGSLSGEFVALNPERRSRARASLERLPDAIGLISPRTVVPVMAALQVRRQLNMLTAEALAVALVTGGRLYVTVESPLLTAGADDLKLSYVVLR